MIKDFLESLRLSSIRTQILIGFGFILSLTLIIVLINFIALQSLQSRIEETVEEASRIRELSLEIQNNFLLARQEEANFLENWRAIGFALALDRHARANQWLINEARTGLEELDELAQTSRNEQFAGIKEQTDELAPLLDTYEDAFAATVEGIDERSRAGGIERRLDSTRNVLEQEVITLGEANEFNRAILQLNTNELAYFNTGEQQYLDQTRLLDVQAEILADQTPHLSWAYSDLTRPGILSSLYDHMAAFEELVALEGEISGNASIFREVTSDIGALTNSIGQQGADGLSVARDELRSAVLRSTTISILAGLFALVAGVVTALLLGNRILTPLGQLTEAARQVGRGNLDYRVGITGEDEFSTLGNVFNQMARQLREFIGSLEKLVADRTLALTTSFQVSRRLSTILDQSQLVSEVVEQVRSAFDYYHAHIYLFDDRGEQLIMVGGTGEPGQIMLNAGHKLDRGQGLVGQAAETNRPVVVPDVSKDSSWLPNPLLPDTRAEVAVPIALGNQVLGVLDVQHDVSGGMGQADAELLQSIANQVAIALENARLYEGVQHTADQEALLNIINQKIQRTASVESVLEVAARELARALPARRANVQLNVSSLPGDDRDKNGRRG